MNTQEVITFFGGKQAALAKALSVTPSAVAQWKDKGKVPIRRQYELEKITEGKLRVRWDDRN